MNELLESVGVLVQSMAENTEGVTRVLLHEGEHALVIDFDDGVTLIVDVDDRPPRLVVQVSLGLPPEQDLGLVAEAALAFNLLWRETGGARVGCAAQGFTLLADIPWEGLDVHGLRLSMFGIRDAAAAWQGFIATPLRDAAERSAEALARLTLRA